jgi:diaminopropionate ammonia-lyase
MAGLACGETSPLAWKILESCVDDFMTISDADAIGAMRRFADGTAADIPLLVGESGAAGYAGLELVMQEPELARAIGLNSESRVLVISTEGATAPAVYSRCVGETADSVLSRQAQWLGATVR